jgi:hypothetical protein
MTTEPHTTPRRSSIWPTVFVASIGLVCGVGLIVLILDRMAPREVTVAYWYAREEVRMLERVVGGQKMIVPFQTKPTEPELRQAEVKVSPTAREVMILWIYGGIAIVLLLVFVTCVVVLVWAWMRKEEPPEWAKNWANSLFSGLVGALFGFIGAQNLPDPARTPPPPPPAVSQP